MSNVPPGPAKSFCEKLLPSPPKHPERALANRADVSSTHATPSPNSFHLQWAQCPRARETALRPDCRCRFENLPARFLNAPARHNTVCPKSLRDSPLLRRRRRPDRNRRSSPCAHRKTECWPVLRRDEPALSHKRRAIPWPPGSRSEEQILPEASFVLRSGRRGS